MRRQRPFLIGSGGGGQAPRYAFIGCGFTARKLNVVESEASP